VQGIPAAAADLSMDPPCGLPVRVTLRLSETVCVALCPATRFQALSLAGHDYVLQTQVDADGLARSDTFSHFHLDR
jgi:hypothetical protein